MTLKRKVFLDDSEMPRQWYNLAADLPTPMLPPLGPDGKPISPDALAPVFPMNLIEQEVSSQRWIDIPEEILEMLSIWRSTPLVRAYGLEAALKTPARIYYKNESVSPAGSHKPNTAIAQAWYYKQFGIKNDHGNRCRAVGKRPGYHLFRCWAWNAKVFVVRISFDQKPFRKLLMNAWVLPAWPVPAMRPRRVAISWPPVPKHPAAWA
jgi:tryptophan synthase beta chain